MTSNGHITRDEFFAAAKPETRDVELPNGQKMELQSIGITERMNFTEWLREEDRSSGEIAVRAVCLCSPIFTEEDEEQLSTIGSRWLDEAGRVAMELIHGGSQKKSPDNTGTSDSDEAESAGG